MCGIIGCNKNRLNEIKQALKTIKYRGPDHTKIYNDNNFTLGHNRLSIIDLNSTANQPMSDINKEIYIVFNGEIYNYKKIKIKLSKKYKFKTNSDTEVLIYAYKEWGVKLTKYLQGMYSFAIYDKLIKKIFLFRDPVGIKPLYYYKDNNSFIFCSEIKGILNYLKRIKATLKFNKNNINNFFIFGYIPSPYTMYNLIYKLKPCHMLQYNIEKHKIEKIKKFKTKSININKINEYKKLIEKKILTHIEADVPVGLYFSGGTDSSLIAAILKKFNKKLKTFSITMNHKKEDQIFFKKINSNLKLQNKAFQFTINEFNKIYKELMGKVDEPLADHSLFPTYYLSKKASKEVKVVLSGEGGDELFWGYNRHKILNKLKKYKDSKMTYLDKLYFTLPKFKGKQDLFKQLFSFFKQPFSYYLTSISISKDLINWKESKQILAKIKKNNTEIDKELYLENDLLRKIDFATSYNSIEGRVPFLDLDIINNSINFESLKLKDGIQKSLLKSILTDYLPKRMVYRGKSGFGLDIKELFKKSKYLQKDLNTAHRFLKTIDLLPLILQNKKTDTIIKNYPALSYGLINLYYCIKNND
jgi:asparagine synthase (glutamine-hydrolysing)